jgi:hypothetical protein
VSTQPEALRLADALDRAEMWPPSNLDNAPTAEAASELRRQHARIAELEAALRTAIAALGGLKNRDNIPEMCIAALEKP